jgi:ribonuclease HIII
MPSAFFSIQIEKTQITKFVELLLSDGALKLSPTNPYELYRLQKGTGYIIIYNTGKIVSTNLSTRLFITKHLNHLLPSISQLIIGSDESGKGESLGPLVISAAAVPDSLRAKLISFGVMDSKNLSLQRIGLIYNKLVQLINYETIEITPTIFNTKYKYYKQIGKGLNHMLAESHVEVIKKLLDKTNTTDPIKVVIDQFDKEKTNKELEKIHYNNIIFEQIIHGENELAVASASIIAKHIRELWIDERSREVGFDLRSYQKANSIKIDIEKYFKVDYIK